MRITLSVLHRNKPPGLFSHFFPLTIETKPLKLHTVLSIKTKDHFAPPTEGTNRVEDFSIVLKQRTQASQKKKKKIKDGKNVGYKRKEMRNEVRADGEQELGKEKVSKR